jgi:hypothetical protein
MNKRKSILVSVLVIALTLSSFMALADASVSYGLTCNPSNNIPCGSLTTGTATTSNSLVKTVRFEWLNLVTHQRVVGTPVSQKDGCFKGTFYPDAACDWKVYAYFLKKDGSSCYSKEQSFTVCSNKIYELVCNPPCGSTVDLNTVVTSTARTTNSEIYKVTFTWITPAGTKIIDTVTNRQSKTESGKKVYYFVSTKPLNTVGDWCVKADFIDQQGTCWCKRDTIIVCRQQYIHVVPEIPMLGTMGASVAMVLAGFAFRIKRKPKN